MRDDFISYVRNKLQEHKIYYDPTETIQKLTDENSVKLNMTNDMKYKILMIKLSGYKIFKNILENKDVLYDIHINLPAKPGLKSNYISNKIKEKLENRILDVFVTEFNKKMHIYVNLDIKNAYKPETGYEEIMCYALPYFLIYTTLENDYTFEDFVFNEVLLEKREFEKDSRCYNEVISSLYKTKTPVAITDSELMSNHTTSTVTYPEIYEIELKVDDKKIWPNVSEERKLTKALYYTMLYSKNPYKYRISEDWFILKRKNNFYKITARLNDDKMSNKQTITRQVQKYIKAKHDLFKYNIMAIKQYLSAHGFYPLIYDDLFISIVCCLLQKEEISPGAFFRMFLRFDFTKINQTYNIETNKCELNDENEFVVKTSQCYYIMPKIDDVFTDRLSMLNQKLLNKKITLFNNNFELKTSKLLFTCFDDYDFVLSKNLMLGFENISNKQTTDFLLGKPLFEGYENIFGDLANYAYFFYSPDYEVLCVKQKIDFDTKLLISILLSRTSFEYIRIAQ